MKFKITCFLLLLTFTIYSQNKFVKGYYIENTGKKNDCLIKNLDWKNNPTNFEIKNSLNSQSITISINDCKEFSVENESKFIRETTQLDTSSENYNQLDNKKEPNYIDITIFLRVLVEGENDLFLYENEYYPKRFFYRNNDSTIKQLVYKKYYDSNKDEGTEVFVNEFYKRQLTLDVKCNDISKKISLQNVKYSKENLILYFTEINNCNNPNLQSKTLYKQKKTIFSLKGVVAFNNDNIKFQSSSVDTGFNKKNNFSFGADIEILLPFNNYCWGIFIEPNFSKYNGNQIIKHGLNNSLTKNVVLDMNVIQVPFGVKYYFNSKSSSSLYLSAGINVTNVKEGTKIDFENTNSDFYLTGFSYTFFGVVGYKYKKIAVEIRANSTNNAAASNGYDIQFDRTSLVLKYELLKNNQ